MVIFTKESLDTLKNKIDLVEALSPYVEFKRAGASFKALCPFHDERSPSFMIQKGDTHYHCFGCGAHGDAIAFLMDYQKLSFRESVELLAEKFQVHLERSESEEEKGPSKRAMREALDFASKIFHTLLLNTAEGHQALRYLMNRGISLDFV
ncbi:MAG: CHC2 zinc finger domain-containing protein, partial [Parachlamydiaceae bacterium]